MSRVDGRQAHDLRPVTFTPHYTRYAEGAALVAFGETRVLCTATVDTSLPPWMRGVDQPQGWITATYSMLPRSTHTRNERETRGPSGRSQEIQRLIGRSLRASADLTRWQNAQVIVDCDVLQADGGTRTAAITGGWVALALAVRQMTARGLVLPETRLTPVAAVSVGVVSGAACLDLCYDEDSTAEVDFNVVMLGGIDGGGGIGDFIEVQGTAEHGGKFSRAELDGLLDLATAGIEQLFALQQAALAAAER